MKLFLTFVSWSYLYCLLAGASLLTPNSAVAQALDTTYNASLTYTSYALGIQSDGKLIIGDGTASGREDADVFRFNVDGSIDTSFNYSCYGYTSFLTSGGTTTRTGVRSVSCFLDGTTAISGQIVSVRRLLSTVVVPKIFKVNEAGSLVPFAAPRSCFDLFGTRFYISEAPYIISLPSNGAFMFGEFNALGTSVKQAAIAKLSSSGALVTSFVPKTGFFSVSGGDNNYNHNVLCVCPQPDGKLIIAGDFESYNANFAKKHLVRVTSTGALDSTFNPSPDDLCYVVALQADGKILVGGNFSTIGGGGATRLARLNANGTLDTSFAATPSSTVYSIQVRLDGKIVIGGFFTSVNGVARGYYAVLNSDGSLAADYAALGANFYVGGLAIQNDGKIILGGQFTQIGSTNKGYLARLTPDVAAVNTLSIDANGTMVEWTRSGSAPEIENAEFRMRTTGTAFSTLLGKGVRTFTGWKLDKLKLPGNKNFEIQAEGLSRGGLWNASTSVISTTSEVFNRPLPVITASNLTDRTVVVGDATVSYSITATSAATITYQWKRNGKSISGATSSSYSIPAGVVAADDGVYTCTVTSTAGSVTTPIGARLTVITPITITRQPVFQAVLPGKKAIFAVTVTGTSPIYQWFKGSIGSPTAIGSPLPTYTIPIVSAADENDYWVEITNFAGMVRSDLVKLYEVTVGATVTTAPGNAIFAMGSSVSIGAVVSSESPPVNQWLRNNKAIKGATSIPLQIPSVKLTDAGKYNIKTTNPAGTDTSVTAAEVAVVDQLSTKHFVIAQNGRVSLTAIAAGNGLTYKWKKVGGTYTADTEPGVTPSVVGSSAKTLTIKGLQTTDTAAYVCEVTAPGGMLPSASQQVTVTTDVPVIALSHAFPVGMVNADYDYTVPVDGPAEITPNKFVAKGLPKGLKIDSFSGRITGRPSLAKTTTVSYPVTISVSNGSGPGLSVTKNLEVRPLTGAGALVGSFIGIITPSAPGTAFESGGRIDLTTTTAGSYSGRLTLGTVAVSFKGGKLNAGVTLLGVDTNGTNNLSIPRKGLTPLTIAFDLNIADLLLENGQLSDGSTTTPFSGWKRKWSSAEKALPYRGYYTMAIEAPAAAPGDLSYPLGDGYATFTVSDLGALTVTGKLADGTGFTTSSGFVGPTGQIAVYNSLYSKTGGYLLSDSASITSGTAPAYLESSIGGSLKWLKRPQTSGYSYATGFGPLNLNLIGARYNTSSPGTNVIGASILTDDVQLTYTGANVDSELVNPNLQVKLTERNAFVVRTLASGDNDAATAISVSASKGIITTSFVINEDTDLGPGVVNVRRTAKGTGVVVRNLGSGAGVGYGHFILIQSPGSKTSELLSGRVRVTDVP